MLSPKPFKNNVVQRFGGSAGSVAAGGDDPRVARERAPRQRAENEIVGVPSGIMDQMASMACTAGHVLLLDTRSLATEQIPFDPDAAGLALLVIDTHVSHALADGAYADPGGKKLPRVDGHMTTRPGLGLLVLVADCYPVALSDGARVAMLHCGWRPLAAGMSMPYTLGNFTGGAADAKYTLRAPASRASSRPSRVRAAMEAEGRPRQRSSSLSLRRRRTAFLPTRTATRSGRS